MRKHLLGLMLIAGLAACSSDNDSNPAASGPVADPAGAPVPGSANALDLPLRAPGSTSFASLPDRGELLAYGGARKSRQSGAYTYHPVALSEEHALNAIATGEMVLATPDGETLRLGYENHEEHPDGNWTWIGRDADGSSAVLTFGEKAVFGLVTHGGEQFRVRTDRTGAWVVATDRTRLAPGAGRSGKSDVLLPPEAGALASAGLRHMQKSTARAVPGKAGGVVDVLLGYSSGLTQTLGSQQAAQTRMRNLIAVTNTAYANSGITMRLRGVHALQVNYADGSDNEETLQQLTGYNASTRQTIPVNSAFSELRAARDEYGADLVAFVRQYREPEQNGCGIAWLLGMNGSGIQAARDAEFGYAVISDGEDRNEGDGYSYFCSDFSLAHELGHLMGQAHNSDDADDAGAHPYSYGYRETSASGFFTIMAYPLGETQIEIPHFANPAVRYQNRPTGTANADNARSMNQTMPIIAGFRATKVAVPGRRSDFNKDGESDILWRNVVDGRNTIWLSAANGTQQAVARVANKAWRVEGTGDFNGDGSADILWRNASNGQNTIWLSGNNATQMSVATVGLAWQIAGVGDFNGDGVSDILWRNGTTGQNVVWLSASNRTQSTLASVRNKAWGVAGIGDFNGDGRSDILWRNSSTGENQIWRSANNGTQQSVARVANKAWRIVGVGDFNGDGVDDILWRNSSNGENQIWRSANNATQQAVTRVSNKAWSVVGVADFNGDGIDDILWRNRNGQNQIWRSANNTNQQAVAPVGGGDAWQVVGL